MGQPLSSTAFGWGAGWTARARALFRADDDGFTDEEILTILSAGEAGLKIPDLCAAGGIRMATYYVWKAKYAGLTPFAVRDRRLRDRRKRQATMAASAVIVVLSVGAAGMLLSIRNASQPDTASANVPEPPLKSWAAAPGGTLTIPALPNLQSAAAAYRALQSDAIGQPSQGMDAAQPVGLRASASWAHAGDIESADPNGFVVQVAAVPDLQEARAVLEQLAEAGHHAYLTATIVDRVELYRVRVGPLKSRLAAEDVARRLEREGHRGPWVTNR